MTLYRSFAWNARAKADEPDGPLWFPRSLQGDGRHDNPDLYGCLYLSEQELSPVVEQLARFRTQRLIPSMLRRRGLPLALAEIDCTPAPRLIDLDDPAVLVRPHAPALVCVDAPAFGDAAAGAGDLRRSAAQRRHPVVVDV